MRAFCRKSHHSLIPVFPFIAHAYKVNKLGNHKSFTCFVCPFRCSAFLIKVNLDCPELKNFKSKLSASQHQFKGLQMLFGSESWLTAAREMFKGFICWIPGLLTHYEFICFCATCKTSSFKTSSQS